MEILETHIVKIKLDYNDHEYMDKFRFHVEDLFMLNGDTYKIMDIRYTPEKLELYLILELVKRAINFYVLTKDEKIYKVADFNENATKEK